MDRIRIGKNRRRVETEQGMPVFLLADTVWSASSRASDKDWDAYLTRRAAQGFNAVLLDALPADAQPARLAQLAQAALDHGLYPILPAASQLEFEADDGSVQSLELTGLPDEAPRACRPSADASEEELCEAQVAQLQVLSADELAHALPDLPVMSVPALDRPGSDRTHIRAALWRALLGGAVAGVAYQALGLWDWTNPAYACTYPAAEDYVFAKQAVDYFDLTWGEPWAEILSTATADAGVAAARTSSTALVYVPNPQPITLRGDFSEAFVQAIDLTSGEGTRLDFVRDEVEDTSSVQAHPFAQDALYVIRL